MRGTDYPWYLRSALHSFLHFLFLFLFFFFNLSSSTFTGFSLFFLLYLLSRFLNFFVSCFFALGKSIFKTKSMTKKVFQFCRQEFWWDLIFRVNFFWYKILDGEFFFFLLFPLSFFLLLLFHPPFLLRGLKEQSGVGKFSLRSVAVTKIKLSIGTLRK